MNERRFVFGHMEKVSPKPAIPCFLSSRKKGLITKKARLRRIDNALENGQLRLARWLAKPLDHSAKKHINAWVQARRQPAKFLTKKGWRISSVG